MCRLIAAGAAISGAVILYTQAAGWLKTAVWNGYSIREALWDLGLPEPTTQLLGLQKIIDTVLGWPTVGLCVAAALAFAFIWLSAGEAEDKLAPKSGMNGSKKSARSAA
jgi:hypothetical protein